MEKKGSELGTWDKCRDEKDLLQLLNLIDMVCNDGNTGTNKDKTYVCISQARKFHNFIYQPNHSATKFVHEASDMYDTYKNCVRSTPFGAALMVQLIQDKHQDLTGMKFYYNDNSTALVPALDLAYKERYLSCFIIMNDDMKGGRDKILYNQMICGTKPFDIT